MGDIYKYKQLFWTVGNSFFHKLYILGQRIRLEKVLLVGSKDFTLIGRPFLPRDQISVEATVVEKTLTHKKVNHWRNINHRQRKTQCKFYLLKKNNIDKWNDYSDLPNNRAANLIIFWEKKHLHNLIRT